MAGQASPRPGGGARSGEGSARLGTRVRKPRAAPSQPLVCGAESLDLACPGSVAQAPRRDPARSPAAASESPVRAKAPPHARSSPLRGDALDLAVAFGQPTGSPDPSSQLLASGDGSLSSVQASWLAPHSPPAGPVPCLSHIGFPSRRPTFARPLLAPWLSPRFPYPPVPCACHSPSTSRFWYTSSAGSSTLAWVTTLPPAPALRHESAFPSLACSRTSRASTAPPPRPSSSLPLPAPVGPVRGFSTCSSFCLNALPRHFPVDLTTRPRVPFFRSS
ncbi:PREDICTED: vegetative cell wall protein gp1-like [Rhinopithecus bieti]|uniref:vegetative cell wall protein gp1-like n=1 Tax=Rhinopithecus bieti TaxID=61621 RepID=UPI00083BCE09|nr:PREDICTED: vegetative cell wall protein gp1-like [Rhinopithecus bieti]